MVKQFKDLMLLQWLESLLWWGLSPCLGSFHMPLAWLKKKKNLLNISIKRLRTLLYNAPNAGA